MANKKAKKKNRLISGLLVVVMVLGIITVAGNRFLSNIVNTGEEIKEDIRTAEDIKDDVVNILVCGIDYEEDRTSANTDVILYVSCDIANKKVSAFQIPRDTYIGDDVSGTGKVNSVFSHGKNKNQIMNLIEVINDKLGLPIDHYATLDMEAFIKMVDGIDGGLQMYVPFPIVLKDKTTGVEETIISEAGWHYVSGVTAEQIVRNRNYPNADVQRLEVQGYFYASLVKYFTENLNVSDFIKIMSRFTTYLTTDMHWTKVASLAKFAFSVAYEDMVLIKPSLHGYDVIKTGKTSATNILVCEEQQWADLLNQYCRPHQAEVSAEQLKMPDAPPAGEVVRDYGVTEKSIRTIADILAGTNTAE